MPKTSTFANKLCKAHKHVVSPLSISSFWPNSTCQLTLKCHNHWDVFLHLRCPGSKERREDEGRVIMSLSSCSAWLAHARPDYRSWCWRRVTLRLPASCYQKPPENWVRLGLGSAPSPFAPALVPMQVLVEEEDQASGPGWRPKPKPVIQPFCGVQFYKFRITYICNLKRN